MHNGEISILFRENKDSRIYQKGGIKTVITCNRVNAAKKTRLK